VKDVGPSFYTFTPAERVALETILEERPSVRDALSKGLTPVLDDLARTYHGLGIADAEADELLLRLQREFVGRMLAETEPWGKDEDLREPVVDLVVRHLLAEVMTEFLERVLASKWN
jgi:hypothetical protein